VTGQADFSLIVGYGTDMGNAEDAAMSFAEAVADIGITAEAIELNQIEVAELRSATHFVVVTSTFGDGEFPDNKITSAVRRFHFQQMLSISFNMNLPTKIRLSE